MTEPNKPTEAEVEDLSSLLRRVSANATREIDNLISELQTLRDRLHADSGGVERVIVKYEALTQSVIQLTKIIADGVTHVKTVPDAASCTEIIEFAPPISDYFQNQKQLDQGTEIEP